MYRMKKMTKSKISLTPKTIDLFLCISLFAGSVVMILPFFWMLSTAFKPDAEIASYPIHLIPYSPTWDQFKTIFERLDFALLYLNSGIVTGTIVVSTLFFCSLTGFVFAKLRFPLRKFLFVAILVTMMVPMQIRLVPLYLLTFRLKLMDSLAAVILPNLMSGFGVLLMRQSIESAVPDELLDAARIDGCSIFRMYWTIVLPTQSAVLSALGIFSFVWSWRLFLWPLIVIQSPEKMTIELGLTVFTQPQYIEWGPMMAAGTVAILPVLIFFLIMQKRFIKGIALSGLKGV